MVKNPRLNLAGRLFAIGGVGFLGNFLSHLFTGAGMPYGPGMPSQVWLPASITASAFATWGGVIGGCIVLMRDDPERARFARWLAFVHVLLLGFVTLGVQMSFVWHGRSSYSPLDAETTQLYTQVALMLCAGMVALALLVFYEAGRVFWFVGWKLPKIPR